MHIQLEFEFMNDPKNKNNDMQDFEGEIFSEGDFGDSDQEIPYAAPTKSYVDDIDEDYEEDNYFNKGQNDANG